MLRLLQCIAEIGPSYCILPVAYLGFLLGVAVFEVQIQAKTLK